MFELQYYKIPKYFIIIFAIILLPFKIKRAFAWTSIYINNQRNQNGNQLNLLKLSLLIISQICFGQVILNTIVHQ